MLAAFEARQFVEKDGESQEFEQARFADLLRLFQFASQTRTALPSGLPLGWLVRWGPPFCCGKTSEETRCGASFFSFEQYFYFASLHIHNTFYSSCQFECATQLKVRFQTTYNQKSTSTERYRHSLSNQHYILKSYLAGDFAYRIAIRSHKYLT